MKEAIHPEFHTEAQVICACGNSWNVGATVPMIRTDICSACHPFFTGEQRIVDTEGQVERFMRRLERREELLDADEQRKTKKERRRRRRAVAEIVAEEDAAESAEDQTATEVAG